MEAFIALLMSIAFALLLGYRRGHDGTLDHTDTKTLVATYSAYLRAVSAAGLVRLSHFLGDPPAHEDLEESVHGPRLIADMVGLVEGERANTVINGLHGEQDAATVNSFLSGIAADAEKYWPDQTTRIHHVRESLA